MTFSVDYNKKMLSLRSIQKKQCKTYNYLDINLTKFWKIKETKL